MTDFASLCVLSYERPEFLHRSLDSLRENTHTPYELIIHDDGSVDDTVGWVLDYHRGIGATTIQNRRGHNEGQGTSLNRMFSIAKGDPIIKLDADLKYYKGWLNEVNRLMNENPKIGLLGLMHYYHEPVHSHNTVFVRHLDWSEHTHILGSAFAVRREVWEYFRPFPEHSDGFGEDRWLQDEVHKSVGWAVALPKENLTAELDGGTMGPGKSSIFDENQVLTPIHKGPYINNG